MTNSIVHIIGAGISGLTIAHLLSTRYKNIKVHIYEKKNYIGGKVGMTRENGYLQEHSPRIFSDNYINFFNLMKEIPTKDNKKVYDKVTSKLNNYLINKDCSYTSVSLLSLITSMSFCDILTISYYIIRGLLSSEDRLRNEYDRIKVIDIIDSEKSKKILEKLAYIVGEKLEILPMYKLYKIVEYEIKKLTFDYPIFRKRGPMHFTDSLDTVIFDNWKTFLEKNGVEFHLNTSYINSTIVDNNIIDFSINTKNGEKIDIDIHENDFIVLALNIEALDEINKKIHFTNVKDLLDLRLKTSNHQYATQVYFKDKITFKKLGTVMVDNFIIQPLGDFYNDIEKSLQSSKIKSFWSIGLANPKLYNEYLGKTYESMTYTEFQSVIRHLIKSNRCLQKYIVEDLSEIDIIDIKIWKDEDLYFWNSNDTVKKRPGVLTKYNNLLLSGAVIDNNFYSYFVEGASTVGFMTTNEILNKLNYSTLGFYKHYGPLLLTPFRLFDNIIYKIRLPNIIDVIIYLFQLFIIRQLIKFILKIFNWD